MAFSYLTQGQKDTIDSLINNVHLTFAINIKVFKINKKTSLSSNPNYNSIYRQGQTNVVETEESREILARVRYLKMGEEIFNESDGSSQTSVQSRIIMPAGSVRLKVDNEAHLYMQDCKRVEINGQRFVLFGGPRKIGFFQKENYWEYFLTPIS